jgi:hypothetical protein
MAITSGDMSTTGVVAATTAVRATTSPAGVPTTVTIITITVSGNSSITDAQLKAAILAALHLTESSTLQVVIYHVPMRDVTYSFYFLGSSASTATSSIQTVLGSNATALGFPVTGVSTSTAVVYVPSTTGVVTTHAEAAVQASSTTGLTTSDKIAIGVLVPVGVILIVSILIAVVYYRRKNRGDVEKGSIEMNTVKKGKTEPAKKPAAKATAKAESSGSDSESESGSRSRSSSSATESSATSASSKKTGSSSGSDESSDESSSEGESVSSKSTKSSKSSK